MARRKKTRTINKDRSKLIKPTFKMPGSKAVLGVKFIRRKLFPMNVNRYFEGFHGRGNMFFNYVFHNGKAKEFHLNDLNQHYFMQALKEYNGDYSFVDEGPIRKHHHKFWFEHEPCFERELAESYVCRSGAKFTVNIDPKKDPHNKLTNKNKSSGVNETTEEKVGNYYCRLNTIHRFKSARHLLRTRNTFLHNMDYLAFLKQFELLENDFIYLDPPYLCDQEVFYANINHVEFLDFCLAQKCKIAISGYWSDLYGKKLKDWNMVKIGHASTLRAADEYGRKPVVYDYLWVNYDLPTS